MKKFSSDSFESDLNRLFQEAMQEYYHIQELRDLDERRREYSYLLNDFSIAVSRLGRQIERYNDLQFAISHALMHDTMHQEYEKEKK